MAGFFDSLAGWKTHPNAQHVDYKVTPRGSVLVLEAKCSRCGKRLYWECHHPDRAAERINRWASWPCHMH